MEADRPSAVGAHHMELALTLLTLEVRVINVTGIEVGDVRMLPELFDPTALDQRLAKFMADGIDHAR